MRQPIFRAALGAAVIAAAAGFSSSSLAQQNPDGQQGEQAPNASRSLLVHTTATVESIDKDSRTVTFKGAQGRVMDVQAAPDVNLNAIKVGNKVAISYYQEVAVAIGSERAAPSTSQTTTARGGVTARQTTVTATILSTDPDHNLVTVKGPHHVETVNVQDPALQQRLRTIKPGQNVTLTYTQALATSMLPEK